MSQPARGAFDVKSWDEKPYEEIEGGAKLTRAKVTQSFHGDLEGEGTVEYLMMHRADKTADFVGLLRAAGRLGGRAGSFVLEIKGTFDGKAAQGAWSVVAGSETGDLRGLRGQGGFTAPLGPNGTYTLDYELE
jgi:hypothetical protein